MKILVRWLWNIRSMVLSVRHVFTNVRVLEALYNYRALLTHYKLKVLNYLNFWYLFRKTAFSGIVEMK